jgi:hypothetical protein
MSGFASKRKMGLSRMSDEVQQSPPSEDWGLQRVKNWKLKVPVIPKRCFLTGQRLWFKPAYYGVRMITGPGDPVYDHYWIDKDEFLLWHLRR